MSWVERMERCRLFLFQLRSSLSLYLSPLYSLLWDAKLHGGTSYRCYPNPRSLILCRPLRIISQESCLAFQNIWFKPCRLVDYEFFLIFLSPLTGIFRTRSNPWACFLLVLHWFCQFSGSRVIHLWPQWSRIWFRSYCWPQRTSDWMSCIVCLRFWLHLERH